MTTWDDLLSHYYFDSKTYNEHCDPADLHKPFVNFVPSYPMPAFQPNSNPLATYSYHNVLLPILPSADTLYDFPLRMCLNIYLATLQGDNIFILARYFLSFYNHSDFLKMHMHNAWLFGKSDVTMHLTSDYFLLPKPFYFFLWKC